MSRKKPKASRLDKDFIRIVKESTTFTETAKRAGYSVLSYEAVRRRIKKLGLTTTHFRGTGRTALTKEILEGVVPHCLSYSDVARKLHKKSVGGNLMCIRRAIEKYGIDTKHFQGYAHNKGKRSHNKRHWKRILTLRKPWSIKEASLRLRRAAVEGGLTYQCQICGMGPEWQDKNLVLPIDHINGKYWDNRKKNLRFLCPNCHSQTDNYCTKNRIKKDKELKN
jgi:predicted RNA-binding Zn-ribbon protein involved in translation (DUF1610 family)